MFSMSPAVNWTEKDLTTSVVGAGTTGGAFVGPFKWGPVLQKVLLDSEPTLVSRFGKPDNDCFVSFFTAANFLSYGNNLTVVRVVAADTAKNASADGNGILIKNEEDYTENYGAGSGNNGTWAAKYPGDLGNSLSVSIADAASFDTWAYKAYFNGRPGTSTFGTGFNATNDELHVVVIDKTGAWTGIAGTILERYAYVSKASDAKKEDGSSNYYATVLNRQSQYVWWMDHPELGTNWGTAAANVSFALLATSVVLTTETGTFTVGEVVATAANAKTAKVLSWTVGTKTLTIQPLIGAFVATDEITGATSSATGTVSTITSPTRTFPLSGGVDGNSTIADADIITGYDQFLTEDVNIGLILSGNASQAVALYLIGSIAEVRKDCVVFLSPKRDDVVANPGNEVDDILITRNDLVSTSYAFMDGNWKYQYDKYNDTYRWLPLNGDIAGLAVRTDEEEDPWYSFAGLNRGHIKNVIKLAWNPTKTQRDALYNNGINPVVTFRGEGPVLFGDKTLQTKPSAFDRINVRRLFIVLEKSIATAAKYTLFEFNDEFTRSQFRTLIEPFLRDVQGRRGVTDFLVVCDATNNTPQVINTNNFVGDIYIKPARSINYIQLNFVAVRDGVAFEEIVGRA